MAKKLTYRIRNWSEYNKALVQRGSITLWLTDEAVSKWRGNKEAGKKGVHEAILCLLTIRAVYNLPLRALRGLVLSLTALMGLPLPIPCYTRICRRAKELEIELKKLSRRCPTDIVFDSSMEKVNGKCVNMARPSAELGERFI